MQLLQEQKVQARIEHNKSFECECVAKEVRKRFIRGGSIQYVYQCQNCGEVSGNPVKREVAFSIFNGQEPLTLDFSQRDAYRNNRAEAGELVEAKVTANFWSGYSEYLASPAWAEKRRLLFKRSAGTCEGCGLVPPTEAHHMTYEHVGAEFLFELQALCHACHIRFHADVEPNE